ncbi:hypothetical protein AB0M02_34765 [Actinoplanes sp. NPDC051861]|uniref:hypothetical protein n=1 Tax=Actinoplanes sp. NPDC051861 TaxID=3155170 RepID=UPI00341B03D0
MEFASYLAGEPWTDHPACTHPLLAHLARMVNDYTSDEGRRRLIELVPSVVGLTSDDVRADLRIALRAAATALPVAAEERQRAMAVTVLTARRLLGDLGGPAPDQLDAIGARALAQVPLATRWAERYTAEIPVSLRAFRDRGARAAVHYSVEGIARSCSGAPDTLLHDLLAATIDDFRRDCGLRPAAPRLLKPAR